MRSSDLHARACVCVSIPGSSREVVAPTDVSEHMIRKLRGKNEFTVLVTLKQDRLNSGVVLSVHHSEHRLEPDALTSQLAGRFSLGSLTENQHILCRMSARTLNITVNKAERPRTPAYYPQSIRDPNTELAITA